LSQRFDGDLEFYLPFPLEVAGFERVIFVFRILHKHLQRMRMAISSYRTNNMGREKDQTPTGLFFTNWKAEETTSTFNDEWVKMEF
jgi:hypothetical protein